MLDPPLEITWFYSAVTFHSSRSTPNSPPNKGLLLSKDLFQLLVSCSHFSNGPKKIALLAPIVYELYNIVFDFSTNGLCLSREVEDLVEKIVSYICMCCCKDCENRNESGHFVVSFEDLIQIWTIDRVGEGCKFEEYKRVFFPVLSEEVLKGFDERCGFESLVGIVLCEVFLFRLCLKFDSWVLREELQTNIQDLAVQMIQGFQNYYFIGVTF